jgi:hypothetical protein
LDEGFSNLEGELLLDEKVFTIDGNCVLTRIM